MCDHRDFWVWYVFKFKKLTTKNDDGIGEGN